MYNWAELVIHTAKRGGAADRRRRRRRRRGIMLTINEYRWDRPPPPETPLKCEQKKTIIIVRSLYHLSFANLLYCLGCDGGLSCRKYHNMKVCSLARLRCSPPVRRSSEAIAITTFHSAAAAAAVNVTNITNIGQNFLACK